ncbi:hypothetical protein J057_06461 [Marinobacter nanhaiticus D15-8W]|uniref:Uncharacterized protein n=1 Tax=Marinobacter nanhaiticus D15-8W TaxID=626887 RepID=N6WTX1_9GAMM|nr:hypothetical protein [Marinobacter nanhaiticus]ENO14971.1 hypothetical protein J057_06461 [Marinobacter nanhaiticus D15-8W]
MDRAILRAASMVYCASLAVYFWLVFSPQSDLPQEVLWYMQWWYSQPSTQLQSLWANVSTALLAMAFISAIFLAFLKKWAGHVFLGSNLIVLSAQWLMADYAPQTSLLASIENLTLISVGCILAVFVLSSRLGTFKT